MWDSTETSTKIRSFLKDMPEKTRHGLVLSIERARLAETAEPIHEYLLKELRALAVELGESLPRAANPRRAFFEPLEPYLIDLELPSKLPGRIARPALERIFSIIERDIAPDLVAEFVRTAAADEQPGASAAAVETFRRNVIARMSVRAEQARISEVAERKLTGHLGGERVLAEFLDIVSLYSAHDVLAGIDNDLHGRPETPETEFNAAVAAQFRAAAGRAAGEHIALVVRNRLDGALRLPRMAVGLAGTADIKALQSSPFAVLLDVTLSDIEWMVARVLKALSPGSIASPVEPLKEYAILARNLRAALDLDDKACDWQRRLTAQRTKLSSALSRELGELPALLRRCLRPLRAVGARSASMPEVADVDQALRLIGLLDAARLSSSELALNELVSRVRQDVEAYLEFMVTSAVDDLRQAKGAIRPIAVGQAEILVRLHEAMFGEVKTVPVRRSVDMAKSNSAIAAAL